MQNDPLYTRFRELGWRKLTPAEDAELRAWLAAHPEALADWETESTLTDALGRLPDAPVPSNFTARVMQSIDREATAAARPRTGGWHRLANLLPRAAMAAVVLCAGLLTFHQYQSYQHQVVQREELAR